MSCPHCNPWIPVSESLPDSDTTVLIHSKNEDVSMGFHDGELWRDCEGVPLFNDTPTHWMDLPEGPAQ